MALASPQAVVVTGIVFGKSPTFQVTLAASDNRHAVTNRILRVIGFPDHKFTMVLYCAPSKDPGWPDRVTNDLLVLMNGRGDAKDRHLTKETQLPWSHSLYARMRGRVDKVELVVELIPTSSPPQSSSSAKETDPLLGRPDQTGATAHAVPEQSTKSAIPAIKNASYACPSKLGLPLLCLVFVVLTGSVAALVCYLTSRILPRFLLKMEYVASALVQAVMAFAKPDERGDRDWAKISAAGEQIVKASEAAWDALVQGFSLPLN